MLNKVIKALNNYWEIEHRAKTNLSERERTVDIRFANIFYIVVTIFLFTVTAIFVAMGVFW